MTKTKGVFRRNAGKDERSECKPDRAQPSIVEQFRPRITQLHTNVFFQTQPPFGSLRRGRKSSAYINQIDNVCGTVLSSRRNLKCAARKKLIWLKTVRQQLNPSLK